MSGGKSAQVLGGWGERLAADYLRGKGYQILAAGFRCRYGEIDLIASDARYLVFVEVKLRRSSRYGAPREFVTAEKQRKLIAAAHCYLMQEPVQLQPRFDVIEVYAPQGLATALPQIDHLENAFEGG